MPRQSRIDILGVLHYIMARGIEVIHILRNDGDFVSRILLSTEEKMKKRICILITCYRFGFRCSEGLGGA